MTPPQPPSQTLRERITNYLSNGGLFNPEMMEHDKVRDLLMDCRAALATQEAVPQDGMVRAVRYWQEKKLAFDAARPEFTDRQLRELNAAESRLLAIEPVEEASPQPDLAREWKRGWKWRDDHHAYSAEQAYVAYLAACREEQP